MKRPDYKFNSKADYFCAQLWEGLVDAGIDTTTIKTYDAYKVACEAVCDAVFEGVNTPGGKDFRGKISFPLFIDYVINQGIAENTLGLTNLQSGWDIQKPDYGVDGYGYRVVITTDDGEIKVTVQLKQKTNPTQFVDRNRDHIANFYESSVEDYGVTDRKCMIIITDAFGMNDNCKGYGLIDGNQIRKITANNKEFWAAFFNAVKESAERIRLVSVPGNKIVFKPCQNEILDAARMHPFGIFEAGTGGGKAEIMRQLIEEDYA